MSTSQTTRAATLPERVALAVIGAIALGAGAGVAAVAVLSGVGLIADRVISVPVEIDVAARSVLGGRLPGSTLDSATLAVRGATSEERALLASGFLIDALAAVAIAVAIAWLCRRLWRSQGFGRSLTRVLAVVGLILIVAPLASGFLRDLGTDALVLRLALDDRVAVGFGFDLSGVVAGIALGLLATIAQLGEHLQRDTEGLV